MQGWRRMALALVMAGAAPATGRADSTSTVAQLQQEAAALRPLFASRLVGRFLDATAALPRIEPRIVWRDSTRTHAWNEAEAAALPDTLKARLIRREYDERYYYTTGYGTPLAYARPLELLAQHGFTDVKGRKLLDFGYGTIGHLRLLASLGANATGVDVDPVLRALYSAPGDQWPAARDGSAGALRILNGRFPAEPALTAEAGEGYDLFLSKNTLKNGYLHPAEPVDPRRLVHLGVEDSAFVAALARIVRPGGLVMIYNLCPAPAPPGKPYIPWADGRCPFPRARWEHAGFRVLEFDRNDDAAARAMGHALGWDQGDGGMKLDSDLFASWSLFERRAR